MRGISSNPVNPQPSVQQAHNLPANQGLQQGPARRSLGQRFLGLFRRGQQQAQPPQVRQQATRSAFHARLTPQVEGGRLQLNDSFAGEVIEKQLNQPHKQYSHATTDAGGTRVQVRQVNGPPDQREAVHIQQTPAAVAVLKTSRPAQLADAQRNPDGEAAFPANPGRAHLGVVSGIHSDGEGEQFRLHEGRLHRFDMATRSWQPTQDQTHYSRLIRLGDGQLYSLPQDVDDFTGVHELQGELRNQDGRSSVFIGDGRSEERHELRLKGEDGRQDFQAKRIGFSGDGQTLYACDEHGALYRDHPERSSLINGRLAMRAIPQPELERALGGRVSVEGFMHGDDGALNALVRDRHGQVHACSVDEQGRLTPTWNLSDALVLCKDEGLPAPRDPQGGARLDLGPRGKLAVHQGRLHGWNEQTQSWTASAHRVERLDRGLDGKAYALQNGELKTVDVSSSGETLRRGASHELQPSGKRTQVALGGGLAGSADRPLAGFAVVDDKHFATLDRDQVLRVHVEGRETALAFPANAGRVQSLALDHQQNLYAQSESGAIHKLARQDWQKVFPESNWVEQPRPGDHPAEAGSLHIGGDKQPVARFDGREYRLAEQRQGAARWQPLEPSGDDQGPSVQQRLEGHHRPSKVGTANRTVSSHLLGHTTEGARLKERGVFRGLRAHFHPIDAVKQKGLDVQHHFKGRQGLRDVYADETALLQRLPQLAEGPERRENLQARLEGLNLPGEAQPLQQAMQTLREAVETSSQHNAVRLGQLHGIVNDQGLVKEEYRPSLTSRLKHGLNAGGRHRVTEQLHDAFHNVAPSADNPTLTLLRTYRDNGLHLSHRSLDKVRDKGDRSALVKDQLIFDAHTLGELHALTDELEQLQARPDAERLRDLGERFDALKSSYQGSDLRVFGKANITSHGQLERIYDQRKRFAHALGSSNQALNLNTRRALEVSANDVDGALADGIRKLESGDSLALTRSKGTVLSTPYFSATVIPLAWFSAGAGVENSQGVSISRTGEGADMKLSGGSGRSLNAVVGVGKFLGVRAAPGVEVGGFLGAELMGSVGRKRETDVAMSIKEGDIGRVMANLTDKNASLTELLELGSEHKATETHKLTADIDLWAGAEVRANLGNLPSATAFMRSSLGPAANLNLFHGERREATSHGPDGERAHNVNTDRQFLRKGDIGANLRPVQGALTVNVDKDAGMFSRVPLELSAKINLDRSRQRSFTVGFKLAQPVTEKAVDELRATLRREFPAERGQAPLAGAANGADVRAQLQSLHDWQAQLPEETRASLSDEQHQALHELQQLHNQQTAASEHRRQFSSAERSITSTSLGSGKLFAKYRKPDDKHPWLNETAPANSAQIRELLGSDPRFAGLVSALEHGKGTEASVVLELKDSVRQQIESRCAAGHDIDRELREALGNRDNLRVKSISVKRTASRSHNLATPPLLVGFTSGASISHSHTQGKIEFKYGHNEDRPLSYSLDGEIAKQGAATDLIRAMALEENIRIRSLEPRSALG